MASTTHDMSENKFSQSPAANESSRGPHAGRLVVSRYSFQKALGSPVTGSAPSTLGTNRVQHMQVLTVATAAVTLPAPAPDWPELQDVYISFQLYLNSPSLLLFANLHTPPRGTQCW